MDAILFSVIACGFTPRSAVDSGTVSDPRMARIMRVLAESKYSIHDLSRCTGSGDRNLARFNMPLELGMAMAHRHLEPDDERRHDWLVLAPQGHVYQAFISDIAGFDPDKHDGSAASLVRPVVYWLATRPDAGNTVTPDQVSTLLPAFEHEIRLLRIKWGPTPPWGHIVLAGRRVAKGLT
jgi:hypothetical protein